MTEESELEDRAIDYPTGKTERKKDFETFTET